MTGPGRPAAVVVAAALALTAAGCGSSSHTSAATTVPATTAAPGAGAGGPTPSASSPGAATASVTIRNFMFSPMDLRVKVGTTVTWTNSDDGIPHSVKWLDAPLPDSALMQSAGPTATYSHTFTQAGTFRYICGVHTYMTGEVVVAS